MKKTLTLVQSKTLEYIKAFIEKKHISPTLDEIASHFRVNQSSAWGRVNYLINKGYIKKSKVRNRNLLIVK